MPIIFSQPLDPEIPRSSGIAPRFTATSARPGWRAGRVAIGAKHATGAGFDFDVGPATAHTHSDRHRHWLQRPRAACVHSADKSGAMFFEIRPYLESDCILLIVKQGAQPATDPNRKARGVDQGLRDAPTPMMSALVSKRALCKGRGIESPVAAKIKLPLVLRCRHFSP